MVAARDAGKLRPQKSVQPFQRKRLFNGDFFSSIRSRPRFRRGAGRRRPESCRQETRMSKPTPAQIALSATLKAGNPISTPLRRVKIKTQEINHLVAHGLILSIRFPAMPPQIRPSEIWPSSLCTWKCRRQNTSPASAAAETHASTSLRSRNRLHAAPVLPQLTSRKNPSMMTRSSLGPRKCSTMSLVA